MTNEERIQEITQRIQSALAPTTLTITDDSHQHVGHPGAQSGAGHFSIAISSAKFEGESRVKCHQLIYAALGEMIPTEIHAVQIQIV